MRFLQISLGTVSALLASFLWDLPASPSKLLNNNVFASSMQKPKRSIENSISPHVTFVSTRAGGNFYVYGLSDIEAKYDLKVDNIVYSLAYDQVCGCLRAAGSLDIGLHEITILGAGKKILSTDLLLN